MKPGDGSAETLSMLPVESRAQPLARILHYAKREALSLGLTQTAAAIDQALAALVARPPSVAEPLSTTH